MLTQEIKKKIDSARDILVGKVPDPKAQVEQITTALIYKFMDDMDKQAMALPKGKANFFTNGFEKYAWNKMMDARLGGQERLNLYVEAITKLSTNKHLPPLFRDVFKDAFLPYRDPETLNLFLKDINTFSYDHSENLGDAFEYLLSILGSQGDAGQFRTPRHIIDFIVEVIDPKKDETICDPACGTAGFLISAYKHILKANQDKPLTPDERKRLMGNLTGYDISPDMVKLSLVNMYLHGFPSPNIHEYDTLTSEERWDERFDVMMANPPFMTPKGGIRPHKRFMVQANRSEVLFVDYILEHLNTKGRAGVIVPEGIIFQSANAYKQLRKSLVEDGLYAVVSLPAGVFNPYSGVKTSILFFDNHLAKLSKDILFVKVLNDGFDLGAQRRQLQHSHLPAAIEILHLYRQAVMDNKPIRFESDDQFAVLVPKSKIAESGDYSLSGDRYRDVVTTGNQKWDMVELGKLCEVLDSKRKPITKSDRTNGKYPYYGATGIVDYVDDYIFDEKLVLVGEDGAKWGEGEHTAFIVEGKYWVNNHAHVLKPNRDKILDELLVHLLNYMDLSPYITGVTVPKLNQEKLRSIKIPLPPIEDQKGIVDELNSYQKVIDGARQIIEHHKPSIKIDSSWDSVKLGEVCEVEYGYGETAKEKGDARYIRITDIGSDGYLIRDDAKYVDLTKESRPYQVKRGDVLVARTGATYGKTMIFSEDYPAVFASFLIRLNFKTEKILPEYYWAFAQTENYWNQAKSLVTGGGQPQFNGNAIKLIHIPVPPLERQREMVAMVKEEQKHIESAKRMIEIYEDKIKSKIAEVWGE